MTTATTPYDPAAIFGVPAEPPPRAFISPSRYIQGPGVVDQLGTYLGLIGVERPAVLASRGRLRAHGERLVKSLDFAGMKPTLAEFGGECSIEEIDGHRSALEAEVDSLIAFGGGKCIDTGKAVAHRLGIPVVVAPSLASNDAPCSAISVIYQPDGEVSGVEFYPDSPAFVIVDTALIAAAPARYLIAGMGDAMATWYEAKAVAANPSARTTIGGSPTLAAGAIGEICAATLYKSGADAVSSVTEGRVDRALEDVVEANTLLSGIGFESGGLAVAHAVASALTTLPEVHHRQLHGEMVAIGLLVQLIIEDDRSELSRAQDFFTEVGLPTTLDQVSVDGSDSNSLVALAKASMEYDFIHNVGVPVDQSALIDVLINLR